MPVSRQESKSKHPSSWTAKHAGSKPDSQEDYLSNLGTGQEYNINVDHGEHLHKADQARLQLTESSASVLS